MGIDIIAFKNIKKVDCVFDIDGEPIDPVTREYIDNVTTFYKNPDFPGRADEIEDDCCYEYEDTEHFFRRSYGRYNYLRNMLAQLAGYPLRQYDDDYQKNIDTFCLDCWEGKEGPFSELINFSDCEGVIDSKNSKKLFSDFEKFQNKANKFQDDEFLYFYNSIRDAFKMASDNGVVRFC